MISKIWSESWWCKHSTRTTSQYISNSMLKGDLTKWFVKVLPTEVDCSKYIILKLNFVAYRLKKPACLMVQGFDSLSKVNISSRQFQKNAGFLFKASINIYKPTESFGESRCIFSITILQTSGKTLTQLVMSKVKNFSTGNVQMMAVDGWIIKHDCP